MTNHRASLGSWPRPAASTAVFQDDRVLIVQRGKGGMVGKWSLPGGHIEPGEAARDAAIREVLEETGIAIDLVGLTDVHDVVIRDGAGGLSAHYVLCVFHARWRAGDPLAASDVVDARFVALEELVQFDMTPGARDLIERSWRCLAGERDRYADS